MSEATEKLKIAQIIGNAKSGGVISCVLNFFRNIDRNKFQFDFYTYGESPFDEEIRQLGGRIFIIPNVLGFFKSVKAMKTYFAKENYYAVHAHLTSLSFVPLCAAKRAKIKYRICHAHSTSHRSEKVWLVKNTLKHLSRLYPTHLAGCSRYACCWLYGKRKGREAFVLKNAIDLSRFKRDDGKSAKLKEEYGLAGKKVIGNIGRFEFQKNQLFLLDAFAMLALERDDVDLALVGGGKLQSDIESRISELKLENRVHVYTEKKQVEDYFALFDLFALPSRFEGLGMVAVEAQAMGIPCLLSSEITQEVDVTKTCRFLPIEKSGEWADTIEEMLRCPHYDEMAKVIAGGYDIKEEAKVLEEFYFKLNE